MAEGFKINLLDRDKDRRLWNLLEGMKVADNTIVISGHGTPDHISDDRKGKGSEQAVKLSPLDLAKMIVEEGEKHGLDEKSVQNMKVVLSSCSTGQGQQSFARELSHFFPEVAAPTRVIWPKDVDHSDNFEFAKIYGRTDDEGRIVERGETFEVEVTEPGARDYNDPGRMKTFYSSDYSYCKAHPECDPVESEKPFSTRPVQDPKTFYYRDGRDVGNDHLVSSEYHEYALSPRVAVHEAMEQRTKREGYRADMAASYLDAVKSNTTQNWTKTLNDYPLLAIAYNYRSEMMHRASENVIKIADYQQYEQGIDQYIVQSIKHGSVRDLVPNPIEPQSTELQAN